MRSIIDLAIRAKILYPDGGDEARYAIWIEQAYRQFVRRAEGGIYVKESTIPIVPGTAEYTLPEDYQMMRPHGVTLDYTPRAIVSIARASDVFTVETETAHGLSVGSIVDVSETEEDTLDVLIRVIGVNEDGVTFTAEDANGDELDDAGATAGYLYCAYSATRPVLVTDEREITALLTWKDSTGVPTRFYLPSINTLRLAPVPDGYTPAEMTLRYDADAPEATATWLREALPVSSLYEDGIIGGAHAIAARYLKDADRAAIGQAAFEGALAQFRAAKVDAMTMPHYEVPR